MKYQGKEVKWWYFVVVFGVLLLVMSAESLVEWLLKILGY